MNESKAMLRQMTRSIYDLQKLRIQMGNRIAINFRTKLGQDPGEKLEDEQAKKVLKTILSDYSRLTDGIAELKIKKLRTALEQLGTGPITEEVEFRLVGHYLDLLRHEEASFRSLEHVLTDFSIYPFLKATKGIGPAMAAVIISELDPAKAQHPSSFWKLSGLDVAEDGKGRSRRKEHLVTVAYTDREGNPAERQSITFNPFLKTKLVGVLGPSFLKAKNEDYAPSYYNYKNRLEHHPDHKEKTKLHKHNMANRYMVKLFLIDLWKAWRAVEGLPVHGAYHDDKLGIVHRECA